MPCARAWLSEDGEMASARFDSGTTKKDRILIKNGVSTETDEDLTENVRGIDKRLKDRALRQGKVNEWSPHRLRRTDCSRVDAGLVLGW